MSDKIKLLSVAVGVMSATAHAPPKKAPSSAARPGGQRPFNTMLALALLQRHGPQCGVDLAALSEFVLRPGSIHFLLARAESEGLVSSRVELAASGRFPKRLFEITSKGARAVKTYKEKNSALTNDARPRNSLTQSGGIGVSLG